MLGVTDNPHPRTELGSGACVSCAAVQGLARAEGNDRRCIQNKVARRPSWGGDARLTRERRIGNLGQEL